MNSVCGTFKNGQIVLDGPADWPEGCRLRIIADSGETIDTETPETPEQIEEWLRWYHALEPLEFTPEEEANLTAWRQQKKELDIARSMQRIENLFP
jgi:hypothetical protein